MDRFDLMFNEFLYGYAPSVFGGALFLAVAWIFAYWADRIIGHVLATRVNVEPALATLTGRIARYAILVLSIIAVLQELGVEVASLIAALGIFGFAIAIGLRTTSTNFFTGIMLFILKPYTVGEYIEGERVEGVVESMSLFHTVVVTKDGIYVAVPNAAMWARSVRNYSRPRPVGVDLDITVRRGPVFAEIKKPIVDTLKAEALVAQTFAPLIRISDEKRDSIVIRTVYWCQPEHQRDAHKRVTDALRANLAAAGVTVIKIAKMRKKKPEKKDEAPPPEPPPPADDVG